MRKEILVIKMSGKIVKRMKEYAPQIKEVRRNYDVIVVHGGKEQLSDLMLKFDKKPFFKDGRRVTDKKTLELGEMAFGKINMEFVAELQSNGVLAMGIGGADANFLIAEMNSDTGYEGTIKRVRTEIVHELIEKYVLVVYPLAYDHENKTLLNMDADDLATSIAKSLGAKMIILGEVDGLYDREGKIISRITTKELVKLIHEGVVKEGMIPKSQSCIRANLPKVWFLNGKIDDAIIRALNNEKIGTLIIGC